MTVRPNFKLWDDAFQVDVNALTKSTIQKLHSSITPDGKREAAALLFFLYASGVAEAENLEVQAKAELIKVGESGVVVSDRQKILDELDAALAVLSGQSLPTTPVPWEYEGLRLSAMLLNAPFDNAIMDEYIDAITLFSRSKEIPYDASFLLLWDIYEKFNVPIYQRFFAAAEPDFWENYVAMALKVMGLYLRDAVMEYIEYYELPPGAASTVRHLERCGKLMDVALEGCFLVHKLSPLISAQLDKTIFAFCSDVITKSNPQPLVTYSYRLLDLSSEDFFVTLPKEQINDLIVKAISKLPQ